MTDVNAPLSFAQERVWFLQNLDPLDRSNQFQAAFTFVGSLDVDALRRALDEIVRRHETFRTTFPASDGVPYQRVEPSASAAFAFVDLTRSGATPDEAALRDAVEAAVARPFDVTSLPLARWSLVRVAPERHVLVHVEHHLVHDGWSFNVFLRELTALYRGFATGRSVALADAAPFIEVARRERAFAASDAAARQLAYWTARLDGAPAFLTLPTDRARPPIATHRGDVVVAEISQATTRAIERLARECGATPFVVAFAAFCIVLSRYSGESDLCVGTGVAGRDTPESERAIGMSVNTVVLRADLSGDPTFVELLERLKTVAFDAFANQRVPIERVVDAIAPVRDPSYNPLFNTLFSFHDSREPELDFGADLAVSLDRTMDNASAKMDLNVIAIPRPEGLTLKWEFDRDLFDRETMARMVAYYRHVLERIVDEPERRISRYEFVDATALRERVVGALGTNEREYPRDAAVHELFEACVDRAPTARALLTDEESVSYDALDRRANRLARELLGRGVGPNARVALLLERSADAVVAMLAVLKAGATFVPLDVRYPAERTDWFLRDAGVAVTIVRGALRARLPQGAAVVDLDADAASIARESSERPARPAAEAAYVMYTSGSTGTPKGVRVTHRGIVRLTRSGGTLAFEPRDVVVQYASLAFDAATIEIWGALLSGATLAVAPCGTLSLADLGAFYRRAGASVAMLTTPLFHQLVESEPDALARMRLVMVGGDVMSPAHALAFVRRAPETTLVNGYGPTENTTFTAIHVVGEADAGRRAIPIGRPIANTTVYVLDARRNPVPIDVPGEIWTGGDGVALGYVDRPELTEARFVADPFSAEPGARMYGTGDIGRFRTDGTLEFLGRRDAQVKVRGFRVEVGSIESAIRAHPEVRDVAIAVVAADDESRSLVAHVASSSVTGPELRAYLAARLPDYEIPSRIVVLETLPLGTSGKVDRRALAANLAQSAARAAVERDGTLCGEIEERLGAIWTEVLGVPSVSRHDDFFDLGGHSLMAMRILGRVNAAFGVELTLRDVLERRTIEALAERIASTRPAVPSEPIEAAAPIDVTLLRDDEIEALLRDEYADVAEALR